MQRSAVCQDQRLMVPMKRGHSGYHSYSGSKNFPNYNFRNSHLIQATPAEMPISNVFTKTRPKTCMHCAHLFSNGTPKLSSIHSTLAYAKCRCHRPDTTNKLLREEHSSEGTNGKLSKGVEFAHIAKDSPPQAVLPTLTKSVDHHSEEPLVESSLSGLATSNSKLPTLKRCV